MANGQLSKMEYEVGKNFEVINNKLDAILAKLYPEEQEKETKQREK